MKKIYVMAAFLGASSFAFNQVVQKAPSQKTLQTEKAISNNNDVAKAQGVSIWANDFSVAGDWVIDGSGLQGSWVIGTTADYNPFVFQGQNVTLDNFMNSPGMTSAGNGYAFFDGIQFVDNTLDQVAWIQMANSVDCSTESIVTLKFEQEYRAFSSNKTYVEVSLDGGTTWEQTIDVNPTVAGNTSTTETTVFRNFNVNNSSDVKFRFRWESLGTTGGYGWQVDDVDVLTLADHDIAVRSHNFGSVGLYYKQIPVDQVAPIESSVVVMNQGANDEQNVKLNANEVNAGVYTSSSAPITLVSGTEDSVVVTNTFTPSGQGSYKIDYSVSYDAVDDVPSNNMLNSYEFNVNQFIYARDTSTSPNTVYGQLTGSADAPPTEVIPANLFDIFADAQLTGIQFQFGNVVTEGALVYGEVLDNNLDPVAAGETAPYVVQAGDAGKTVNLIFDTPLNVMAGETYAVSVKCFENDFSVATAGESPAQTSFIYYLDDATWYYTTRTPVIRMNFDPTLSVENNELSNLNVSSNFPNPFANTTTVNFNLKEATDVSYTVVDLTGKVMTEVTEGTTLAGDHSITIDGSSFANGVYYLNITAGESTVTRKMIVNK
ncbi:T9SS type A sorting domain-containing protein [Brumimicrobium oceani]|uniref:Secretion system C-terminal sorting domain-containing protein n=1 Tax=Brumimicrobium oceani TaxID=2100725 RepID=A0A2U2XBW4_9FLAO|nr:T9SS type A sorting domain-containing protein [Brumimicrobium oceani]PWH85285.1 hypothetical protein DIT68_10120 [Brumimicrobium oceani]